VKIISRFVVAAMFLMPLAGDLLAQQMDGNKTKQVAAVAPGTTSAGATAASANPSENNKGSELSERERLLLVRIDKLEQRLAELESRSAVKPPDAAQPASANMAARSGETKSVVGGVAPAAPETNQASASLSQESTRQPKTGTIASVPARKKPEPFAFGDFTWLTGNPRTKDSPINTEVFTGEIRFDTAYHYSFNHPIDHSIGGSSEVFRSDEFQVTQIGVGGDFHYNNIRGRLMTQFGMYSQTTPRNDASPGRGQWNLDNAYRYISEAYGGYHIDKLNGINIDAGIFMSYVGLFSYYQFDNWAYQPSYVSSNTPWFFNGVRIQIFPSDKLKIEPWIVNGWQSYGKFNKAPGVGLQILWRPTSSISVLGNQYWGTDTLGIPGRKRIHTDDSIQVKYLDKPGNALSKGAFTFTFDAGCEYGKDSGVSCSGGTPANPSQYFLGFMAYNRLWFHHDLFGLTLGGGAITNPGRYLVLIPPINGATAFTGTPYFTAAPGDKYRAWDASVTFDYMPTQFSTFRFEYNHRAANVPYFTGEGGVTPPGGNTGTPGLVVPGFTPDLRKYERRFTIALLVKL
jgi:putative OmpL-like beta-barrel porin-2